MLVDGRGVPLLLVVTGTNRLGLDVLQLGTVLKAIMVESPSPAVRRLKHLCDDPGYIGAPGLKAIEEHGYISHIKGRARKAKELKRGPSKRAKRWVVEVASWFNRFRKLLVRFGKLDRSFLALSHQATSIMTFCKI